MSGQVVFGEAKNPIKVSIKQFYGIEINDFAVTVAKTAMWIAESQMMKQTEDIIHMKLDFLPLKSYVNIIEGNALKLNWEDIVSKYELNYIMGNPPFLGARLMKKEQKRLRVVPTYGRTFYIQPEDIENLQEKIDKIYEEWKQLTGGL